MTNRSWCACIVSAWNESLAQPLNTRHLTEMCKQRHHCLLLLKGFQSMFDTWISRFPRISYPRLTLSMILLACWTDFINWTVSRRYDQCGSAAHQANKCGCRQNKNSNLIEIRECAWMSILQSRQRHCNCKTKINIRRICKIWVCLAKWSHRNLHIKSGNNWAIHMLIVHRRRRSRNNK